MLVGHRDRNHDRKFLSFMRSYPNLIPLSAKQVTGIAAALESFKFDTIYGHYFDRVIPTNGKQIFRTLREAICCSDKWRLQR